MPTGNWLIDLGDQMMDRCFEATDRGDDRAADRFSTAMDACYESAAVVLALTEARKENQP